MVDNVTVCQKTWVHTVIPLNKENAIIYIFFFWQAKTKKYGLKLLEVSN